MIHTKITVKWLGFLYAVLGVCGNTVSFFVSQTADDFRGVRMAQMEGAVSFQELIVQKRAGGQLSPEQIRTFIKGVTSGTMQESQIGGSYFYTVLNAA